MIRSYSPETPCNEQVGIVLLNHVGSSASQDTGRDAANLANRFNLHVMAADRPGSGLLLPRPGLRGQLTRDYAGEIAKLGNNIAIEAAAMGIEHMIAIGRSAGGLGALALATTDTLPIRGVYAAEPVGLFETTPKDGRRFYKQYGRQQAELINDTDRYPDLVRPLPTDTSGLAKLSRAATIVPYFLNESHINEGVWSQPLALRYAQDIAENQPQTYTVIDIAEHSMVADEAALLGLTALAAMRQKLSSNPLPFDVNVVPNTVHSSFDNREFLAGRVTRVVENVLTAS